MNADDLINPVTPAAPRRSFLLEPTVLIVALGVLATLIFFMRFTSRLPLRDPVFQWSLLAIGVTLPSLLFFILRRRRTRESSHYAEKPEIEPESAEYTLALQGSNDGLWELKLAGGRLLASERWKEMMGLTGELFEGKPEQWWSLFHPSDRKRVTREFRQFLKTKAPFFQSECRFRPVGESYRWFLLRGCATRDETGRAIRVGGSLTDINDRKAATQELNRQAFHDPLTGLANRAHFMLHLERFVRQRSAPYTVMFLDLDRFKIVNDSLGHAAGDELLISIATRLQTCLRPSDLIARLGGDEFVLLMEGIASTESANSAADRLRNQFRAPFLIAGQELFSSASIGIALGHAGYNRAEDLLRDADTAMYRAKANGKGRIAIFEPEMRARLSNVLKIETDLRHAIENDEIQVYYQPIFNVKTRHIDGFEALARWPHAAGPIHPEAFIPVAEATGLIGRLGECILEKACKQVACWQRETGNPLINLNVNVSPIQFMEADLAERISRILDETGIHPGSLHLEITESAMMEGGDDLKARLVAIRRLEVKLLIDDFGTGYSSLSSLHQYPIDGLKIDREFIARLGGSEEHSAIVRTITALAAHLNLNVTAEGVETEEQFTQLANFRCDRAQGFLFARALSADEAGALLFNCSN